MTENTEAQEVVNLVAEIMSLQANYLNEVKEQALNELEELVR